MGAIRGSINPTSSLDFPATAIPTSSMPQFKALQKCYVNVFFRATYTFRDR